MSEQDQFPKTVDEVIKYADKKSVTFINLWFSDVLGQTKSYSIHKGKLREALERGKGFDGSSIDGFVRIEESDLVAKPIPSTFRVLPYRPTEKDAVASVFCEIYHPDKKRFEGDSLLVLERQLEIMRKMGFDHFYVGPELEFMLFKDNKPDDLANKVLDHGTYFGLADDAGVELRREVVLKCWDMGIKAEISHHEVAGTQHEIDLEYADASEMAMIAMRYRVLVKNIAKQHGVYASFMPKPIFGVNGAGMHVHQSLTKNGKNAFYEPNDPSGLSETARHYIAGIIKHAQEIAAITNPTINSYQRLVPGYEAPTELSWARQNRSTAIRVPEEAPEDSNACRIEVRFPDPSCNPALAFAVMLGAGLEGIRNRYELPEPVERNIYEMAAKERAELGITSLPGSLEQATELMKQSPLVRSVLGEHVHNSLVANQELQFRKYWLDATGREREEHLVTAHELKALYPLI